MKRVRVAEEGRKLSRAIPGHLSLMLLVGRRIRSLLGDTDEKPKCFWFFDEH